MSEKSCLAIAISFANLSMAISLIEPSGLVNEEFQLLLDCHLFILAELLVKVFYFTSNQSNVRHRPYIQIVFANLYVVTCLIPALRRALFTPIFSRVN